VELPLLALPRRHHASVRQIARHIPWTWRPSGQPRVRAVSAYWYQFARQNNPLTCAKAMLDFNARTAGESFHMFHVEHFANSTRFRGVESRHWGIRISMDNVPRGTLFLAVYHNETMCGVFPLVLVQILILGESFPLLPIGFALIPTSTRLPTYRWPISSYVTLGH